MSTRIHYAGEAFVVDEDLVEVRKLIATAVSRDGFVLLDGEGPTRAIRVGDGVPVWLEDVVAPPMPLGGVGRIR